MFHSLHLASLQQRKRVRHIMAFAVLL